ncbi:MAG: chemotaxis protein CheY [Holophagaceae bacterium]|nr:chemotaxis protein CheY [Holophagaceae bacterium]
MPNLILVVDDEPQMVRYLRASLGTHGYDVAEACTAREAEEAVGLRRPDVILLDLGLPDRDGLALTRTLRETCSSPIIVISARGQEEDKIQALDAGADDYLTKPFGTGELLARIRVALRHRVHGQAPVEEPIFELEQWRLDRVRRELTVSGQRVHLTPNEYKLLATLVAHAGKVLTHTQLLKEIWGDVAGAQPHYLRVYMAQLRQKLELEPARPKHLITEPGVGYRLRL